MLTQTHPSADRTPTPLVFLSAVFLVLKKEQEMKKLCMSIALAALAVLLFGNFSTQANNNDERDVLRLSARLSSFNENLPKGTRGHGTFRAQLSSDRSTLTCTLTSTGFSRPPPATHT